MKKLISKVILIPMQKGIDTKIQFFEKVNFNGKYIDVCFFEYHDTLETILDKFNIKYQGENYDTSHLENINCECSLFNTKIEKIKINNF
ncbi:MAG TPA: hypothetical protein V6C58_23505 [Allocoleopsis sp.]